MNNKNNRGPSVKRTSALRATRLMLMTTATLVGAAIFMRMFFPESHSATPGHMTIWMQLHLATVIPAVLLGLYLLSNPKGTPQHRRLGKIWCALMVITALAALMIRGYFLPNWHGINPIHIFSALTLIGVPRIIIKARQHDVAGHERAVLSLCFGGLFVAGLFVFLPGRLMGIWLFGL
jgi:uncharacterized membrane protein